MLTRAGRLILTQSVLSAIPSHFMSVFSLPSWLMAAIDKIRRRFLWGNNQAGLAKINLLSWRRVCQPKTVGGFGLKDLKLHNQAFLLRWLWYLYTAPSSIWTQLASKLYAHARGSASPLTWNKAGSFFWKDMRSLRPLFQLSTRVNLGGGTNTSFWFDNWGGYPLCWLSKDALLPPRQRIAFRDAWLSIQEVLPSPRPFLQSRLISSVAVISQIPTPDTISWFWTTSGNFSVSSFYNAIATAGRISYQLIFWKLRVPPSVKMFLLLLSHDRILTRQQLAKRNIAQISGCMLCRYAGVEDAFHLFCQCSFIRQVWHRLQVIAGAPSILPPSHSFQDTLFSSFLHLQGEARWSTLLATVLWGVWLERNNRIFRGTARGALQLTTWIKAESDCFLKHCS